MKPLLVKVDLKSERYSGPAKLLLTDRSVFIFRDSIIRKNQHNSGLAHAFGLIGAFLAHWVDGEDDRFPPPEHMRDPEIRNMSDWSKSGLLRSALLWKIPLETASPAWRKNGVAFTTDDLEVISAFTSWDCERILRHLQLCGVPAIQQ